MKNSVDLSKYNNVGYNPGRCFIVRAIWYMVNVLILQNPLNFSSMLKMMALRFFGAKIGKRVILKQGINVKYPWNIIISDNSWIGENVWIDSLAAVSIGNNVCISQGAYLCTGNHDWSDPAFKLIVKPITVEDGAWVGARAIVLPGVTVGSHAIVAAGSVLAKDAEPYMIYAGNPAFLVKTRTIKN